MRAHLPKLGDREFALLTAPSAASRTTVVIGENGSGKSTLLRDLALTFRGLGKPERRRAAPAWSLLRDLQVTVDGQDLHRIDPTELRRLQFAPADSGDLARFLPSRVIALSFTPFDKFPYWEPPELRAPRTTSTEPSDEFYAYLGFKTGSGPASPRSRLLRTVDQLLFRPMDEENSGRVVAILGAIGYAPSLRVAYTLPNLLRSALRDRDRSPGRSPPSMRDGPRLDSQIALFERHPRLREAFPRLVKDESLRVEATFTSGGAAVSFDPDALRELQLGGVLSVSAVELQRRDTETQIDLLELSSGELNILSGFLGLAVHLVDGCLVLIDEPENSLHPAWQIRYAEMLEAVLSRFQGCHCIIATHSPLVVSGAAARGSTVVRLDQDPVAASAADFAEESPDATLVNAFDVVTSNNSYVRQLVLEGMTLIESGEAEGARAHKIAARLARIQKQIPADDPILEVATAVVARILG